MKQIWGPFGVNLGSMLGPDGDSGLRPPRDQIFGPLGASLGPMLGLCWPHVGPMLAVVGRLGPSWRVLGAILSLS